MTEKKKGGNEEKNIRDCEERKSDTAAVGHLVRIVWTLRNCPEGSEGRKHKPLVVSLVLGFHRQGLRERNGRG